MDVSQLYIAVHWTARLSAVLFSAALLIPRMRLYLGFIFAHTVHFAFVVWLAKATGGENIFPGGRDMADVGGWPAVFGIFAFFYALAWTGFAGRRAAATRFLRGAGLVATTFIGYMFVSTYVPLIERSAWYALPASFVTAAVLFSVGARMRRAQNPNINRV